MSTARPVRSWIAWATFLIRSRLKGSAPVTPATRTRITLIGAAGSAPWKTAGSVNAFRPCSVVSINGGWAIYPPMFIVGSNGFPSSAFSLAWSAGSTRGG